MSIRRIRKSQVLKNGEAPHEICVLGNWHAVVLLHSKVIYWYWHAGVAWFNQMKNMFTTPRIEVIVAAFATDTPRYATKIRVPGECKTKTFG